MVIKELSLLLVSSLRDQLVPWPHVNEYISGKGLKDDMALV